VVATIVDHHKEQAMTKQHELHAYDYVNRRYDNVRDTLLADPLGVFKQATVASTRSGQSAGGELHGQVGPLDVGAEIEVDVLGFEETRSPSGRGVSKIGIAWKAAHRPGLFPTMRAELLVYPLTPTETQLELAGTYDPPFGVIGDMIDAAGMARLAEETVTNFIHAVASYLRGPASAAKVRAS